MRSAEELTTLFSSAKDTLRALVVPSENDPTRVMVDSEVSKAYRNHLLDRERLQPDRIPVVADKRTDNMAEVYQWARDLPVYDHGAWIDEITLRFGKTELDADALLAALLASGHNGDQLKRGGRTEWGADVSVPCAISNGNVVEVIISKMQACQLSDNLASIRLNNNPDNDGSGIVRGGHRTIKDLLPSSI